MENPIQKIPGLTEVISEIGYGRKLKILQDIVITIRKKLNWSPISTDRYLDEENPKVATILNIKIDTIQLEELLKYIIKEMIIFLKEIYNLPTFLKNETIDKKQMCNNLIKTVKKFGIKNC